MVFTKKEIKKQLKLVPLNTLIIPTEIMLILDAVKAPREFENVEQLLEKHEFLQERLRRWKKSNPKARRDQFFGDETLGKMRLRGIQLLQLILKNGADQSMWLNLYKQCDGAADLSIMQTGATDVRFREEKRAKRRADYMHPNAVARRKKKKQRDIKRVTKSYFL